MKKFAAVIASLFFAVAAHAQNTITLPYAAQVAADIGNGPIKVRVTQGNASLFTSQGSGAGSTSGLSTALTLTSTPTTPPCVGCAISGLGIPAGTTVAAYNGTTGVTLSAASTVPAATVVSWGAACPSTAAGIPAQRVQASVSADYTMFYTQARVCAVSPGGPSNTLLVLPIFYDNTTPGGGGGGGGGTVTSVGLTMPPMFSVAGNPVTTSGVLAVTLNNQSANSIFAGPSSGGAAAPAFRSLVGADLPDPGASTKGGVKSYAPVSSQWINSIGTNGTPTSTQPAFSDLSGTYTNAQSANMAAATIKMNPTASPGAPTDSTIQGLVNLASPDPNFDYMPIYDHLTGTLKNVKPGALAGAALLGSTNTWTAGNYFGSGRPWCDVRAAGAVGNGVADDITALNTCLSRVLAFGGGTIYFPPGVYCVSSTFQVNTGMSGLSGVRLLGASITSTAIMACGHNINPVFMNNQYGLIQGLSVYGYGFGTDTFGAATNPTIRLGPAASGTNIRDVYAAGGTFPIYSECLGCRIESSNFQYAYGDPSAGAQKRNSNVYILNSGQYWTHNSFDQVAPYAGPGYPTFPTAAISAWAASHVYAKGTVVTFTCASRVWNVQAANAGTSKSGAQPNCDNYGNFIQDNVTGTCPTPSVGVCWQLVGPSPFYAAQVDTGSNEVMIDNTDMTGFFTSCFAMTNTFGGTPPTNVWLTNTTPGGCTATGVLLNAGSNVTISGADFQGCLLTGCLWLNIATGFLGSVNVNNVKAYNGMTYGAVVGTGVTDITFTGNFVKSAVTNPFVLSGSNDYIIGIGNNCRTSTGGLSGTPGTNGYFPVGVGSANPGC